MFCWKPDLKIPALQSCFLMILVTAQWQIEKIRSLMSFSHIPLVNIQNKRKLPRLTHEVSGSFANSAPKNKIFQQVGNKGEWHAEEAEH